MDRLSEIEAHAMQLSASDRAKLATRLLHSLPSPGSDDDDGDGDDGVAEALRRDAEMDADPSMCITFEELKKFIGR